MCNEDFEASYREMIDWANRSSVPGQDFEAVRARAQVAAMAEMDREKFRQFFAIGWYACLTRTGGALGAKLAEDPNWGKSEC